MVHRKISLIISFLLLLQCPTCLIRHIWIVLVMRGKWPYSCCCTGCCFQDLFYIVHNILVQLPSSFSSLHFVRVHVGHPYSSIDTTTAWKKFCFNLSHRSDFHMINYWLIAVHTFARRILISHSVDEALQPRYVNLPTNFREPPFISLIYSVLSTFTWRPVPPVACSRLCGRDLAWVAMLST